MANKLKKFFCFLALTSMLATYKSGAFSIEPVYTMKLSPKSKIYVNRNGGISHNTYVIETEDKKLFFKETKKKLSMYETAKRAIVEYFKDSYKDDQKSMLTSLLNEENLKKFIYMKTYGDGGAAKWLSSEDKTDTSVLGFTEPLSNDFKTQALPEFLHYAFAEFVQYRANRNREPGDLQINQLLGSLATMKIAKILGISDLVVKTEYAQIKSPTGENKIGILMDCAKGIPFSQLQKLENRKINPLFQLNLSNLMILDAICSQRDRSVSNYFTVLSKNGEIINVSAYDNDLSFDNYTNLKSSNFILPPMLRNDGKLSLPHMDKMLANKILSLNDEDIRICLKDLLNDNQIDAAISRMNQMQNAIKQTMKENPKFLIEPAEWSSKTMEKELSADNRTYFKYFMEKLNS